MKSGLSFAVLLFLSLGSTTSPLSADTGSASDMSAGSTSGIKRGKHGGKQINPAHADKNLDTVRGACTVAESPSNPISGPCVNLLVVLNDPEGHEVEKTRTTPQGMFDFATESGKKYLLGSGSKFYEVLSPTTFVQSGDKIALVLKQK